MICEQQYRQYKGPQQQAVHTVRREAMAASDIDTMSCDTGSSAARRTGQQPVSGPFISTLQATLCKDRPRAAPIPPDRARNIRTAEMQTHTGGPTQPPTKFNTQTPHLEQLVDAAWREPRLLLSAVDGERLAAARLRSSHAAKAGRNGHGARRFESLCACCCLEPMQGEHTVEQANTHLRGNQITGGHCGVTSRPQRTLLARCESTWQAVACTAGHMTAHAHLAVREDAHVVAVHRRLHQVLRVLKHCVLAHCRVEHLRRKGANAHRR